MQIRPAAAADAASVAAIYDYYVRNTAITFADHTPSPEEYARQMADARYPFLVAEEDGQVVGFAYAAAFRTKEAYRWDVELTIYASPNYIGVGIGKELMALCLEKLRHMGYLNAYSCITLPNERSVGLHRRLGFEELGIFRKTGYKLGKWHDVIWMGYVLGNFDGAPAEPGQPHP